MPAHSPPPPIASIAENIRLRPKASCIGRSENCSATVTTDAIVAGDLGSATKTFVSNTKTPGFKDFHTLNIKTAGTTQS